MQPGLCNKNSIWLNRKLRSRDIIMLAARQFGIANILDAEGLGLAGLDQCLHREHQKITRINAGAFHAAFTKGQLLNSHLDGKGCGKGVFHRDDLAHAAASGS